jgi:predicted ATP-grasp superfamily ATP-dependent carboligase
MPKLLNLLILGASVRAAAHSALRAGLRPWGADLFGDTDLPADGRFQRVRDYPDGFIEIAGNGPAGPWMYTGALENRPELVARIGAHRPLWGNAADVLREIRSPERVSQVLRAAGVACPAVCASAADLQRGDWLLKPRAGSAGHGIARWPAKSTLVPGSHYLQEWIEGDPCVALYVGMAERAVFLGTTRQLVGKDWLHAKSFQYCGSIGPVTLAPPAQASFAHLGTVLAAAFHLRGIFGVDCIVRDGVPFPVEVNPRYTASVEVLELAGRISALDMHQRAFAAPAPELIPDASHKRQDLIGKAILFARATLHFPEQGPWRAAHAIADRWAIPPFADIPAAGTTILRGKPILSFFTTGRSIDECESRLRQIACGLDRVLFGP